MAISPHYDQVQARVGGDREDGGLNVGAVRAGAFEFGRQTAPGQVGRQVCRGRSFRFRGFVDADNCDFPRVLQKWRRVAEGARSEAAPSQAMPMRLNSSGPLWM